MSVWPGIRTEVGYNGKTIIFFKDIDAELRKMLRSDPEIRQAARNGGFKNVGEMLAYYKDKYKFDTQLEQY